MHYYVLLAGLILPADLVSPGLDKINLQFKHREKSTTTIKSISKTHQILNIAGQDLETRSSNTVTMTSSVGTRGSDGRLPIEMRIDAMVVQLSLPMGLSVDFNSANPPTQNDNPRLQAITDTFRARVGSTHTVVLGRNNEVLAVEGAEKILERATPAAAEVLRAEANPELLKKAAQQGYSILPTEPVGPGDTWTRTTLTRIGGGQVLTFETKFEYFGTETKDGQELHRIATSAMNVTLSIDERAQTSLKVTESTLRIESSKGSILFDVNKGQTIESNSATRIVGDLTLSINDMEFPGNLDLTIESSSAVQK
jgi:hypothetical protein